MMIENLSYFFIFLAEAVIAYQYNRYLFPMKRSPIFTGLVYFTSYMLLLCLFYQDRAPANTAGFFQFNAILSWRLFDCSPKTAALHAAFLSFIMTIAEIFTALLISLFTGDFAAFTYNVSAMIAMGVMSKLLYYFLANIGARVFSPHKNGRPEPMLMGMFCILPILSACIAVLMACLSLENDWSGDAQLIIIVSLLSLLVANLIFFELYNYQQKRNEEFLELQLSIQKEEADTAYYRALEEQTQNQRVLIHDIQNHLQAIDSLAGKNRNTEISDYIAGLVSSLKPANQHRFCDNSILNLVISRYAEMCREKQIRFTCDIRSGSVSFLDAPSITTLYGNLLSNAVEAAEKSQEKEVELSAVFHQSQNMMIVSVVNSCDNAPVPANGRLYQTTKQTPGIHGVGLKAIERVVKKYRGVETMYYDPEGRCFHHIVQFPLEQHEN